MAAVAAVRLALPEIMAQPVETAVVAAHQRLVARAARATLEMMVLPVRSAMVGPAVATICSKSEPAAGVAGAATTAGAVVNRES